jgi:DNA-directed RNA polymerase specialized sigma24 family protein
MQLAYVDGLSDEEIAELTGIPRRTVHRYRTDAIKRVRELYRQSQNI